MTTLPELFARFSCQTLFGCRIESAVEWSHGCAGSILSSRNTFHSRSVCIRRKKASSPWLKNEETSNRQSVAGSLASWRQSSPSLSLFLFLSSIEQKVHAFSWHDFSTPVTSEEPNFFRKLPKSEQEASVSIISSGCWYIWLYLHFLSLSLSFSLSFSVIFPKERKRQVRRSNQVSFDLHFFD